MRVRVALKQGHQLIVAASLGAVPSLTIAMAAMAAANEIT